MTQNVPVCAGDIIFPFSALRVYTALLITSNLNITRCCNFFVSHDGLDGRAGNKNFAPFSGLYRIRPTILIRT